MRDALGLRAAKFDYSEQGDLAVVINNAPWKMILCRYSIGFCEDIRNFFDACSQSLSRNGFLIIEYSPVIKAIPLRWMFEDYTYLRQYTSKYIIDNAQSCGLNLHKRNEISRYRWDSGLHPLRCAKTECLLTLRTSEGGLHADIERPSSMRRRDGHVIRGAGAAMSS